MQRWLRGRIPRFKVRLIEEAVGQAGHLLERTQFLILSRVHVVVGELFEAEIGLGPHRLIHDLLSTM